MARAWAALPQGQRRLTTQEGERINILFPGVANSGPGPDFFGAVVRTERGRLVRGQVELHRQSSSWAAHGHQRDPRYNGVVLHVVLLDDAGSAAILQDGGRAPVLVFPWRGSPRVAVAPPSAHGEAAKNTLENLAVLGRQRFLAKAGRWEGLLARTEPDQLLYAAIMEAMGYSQNSAQFQRLAGELPWRFMSELRAGGTATGAVLRLAALLLGSGGFLEDGNGEDDNGRGTLGLAVNVRDELRSCWRGMGRPQVLAGGDWQRAGVRPAAQPWRRLLGVAVLATRWVAGPLAFFTSLEGNGRDGVANLPIGQAGLLRGLQVCAQETGLPLSTAPIGGSRAKIVAVNAVLPLLYAFWKREGEVAAIGRVLETYERFPGLEQDKVVRPLQRGLGLARARLTAQQQQGLHRLFQRYCARGRPEDCPLCQPTAIESGQAQAGFDIQVPGCPIALLPAEVAARGDHGAVVGAETHRRHPHRD